MSEAQVSILLGYVSVSWPFFLGSFFLGLFCSEAISFCAGWFRK